MSELQLRYVFVGPEGLVAGRNAADELRPRRKAFVTHLPVGGGVGVAPFCGHP